MEFMLENVISVIINFLTYPAWHLAVIYIILFALVAWSMVKSWGF